jgi:hypothetical protein
MVAKSRLQIVSGKEKKERRGLSFFLVTAGGAASAIVSAGTIIA